MSYRIAAQQGDETVLQELVPVLPSLCQRQGASIKADGRSDVYRLEHQQRQFAVKRFPPVWQPLANLQRRLIKGRYGLSVWRRSDKARQAGLPVAAVLGLFQQGGPFAESYLLSEWVDGVALEHCLLDEQIPLAQRRELVVSLRDMVLDMHRRKISHGDLKPRNVLIRDAQPVMIDLDALRIHWSHLGLVKRAHRDWRTLFQGLRDAGVSAELLLLLVPDEGSEGLLVPREYLLAFCQAERQAQSVDTDNVSLQ